MAYGNLVSSGNRLAEKALATLCDSFKEKLKCPSVGYPAIMKFALCMEKHGITRGLKNDSSIETALCKGFEGLAKDDNVAVVVAGWWTVM